MGTFSFTSDICDPFWPALACDHSQIIILYTRYITQVYFTFFRKYIVMFKIWMDNGKMVLANLEEVKRKG